MLRRSFTGSRFRFVRFCSLAVLAMLVVSPFLFLDQSLSFGELEVTPNSRLTGDTLYHTRMRKIKKSGGQNNLSNYLLQLKRTVFPSGYYETDDRIEKQLNLAVTLAKSHMENATASHKVILVYAGLGDRPPGQKVFIQEECPISTCSLTGDRSGISENGMKIDAVLFENSIFGLKDFPKRPKQIWVFHVMESPFHTVSLHELRNLVNWTATYRRDSTIVTPYARYTQTMTSQTTPLKRNFAKGKSKLVAWFVSNCFSKSGRLAYAKELQKYIQVDIYGLCGDDVCRKHENQRCNDILKKDYKFYLSFENSICKDYITEKFFQNALGNGVVPVVMGAPIESYTRAAPPDSFIHVDNFTSPKALADYLHYLDKSDTAYNKYFEWKNQGAIADSKFYCRLCAMLHADLPPIWYGDVNQWWKGKHNCDHSKKDEDLKFM